MSELRGPDTRESIAGVLLKTLRDLGFNRVHPILLPLALIAGAALNVFLSALTTFLPLPAGWLETYEAASDGLRNPSVLKGIMTAVFNPCAEELIFRGLICGFLRKHTPAWFALLCSTALFAVLHGTVFWICFAAIGGLSLGLVFLRTGSIYPCFLFHIAFNSINYIWKIVPSPADEKGLAILCAACGVAFAAAFTPLMIKSVGKKDF